MTVYRIDWSALVDRSLVDALATAAGLSDAPTVSAARPALSRILEASGGWPYATAKPSVTTRRRFALRLIGEACAHTLGPLPQQLPGFEIGEPVDGMRAISTVERVEVNLASVDELAALPALGSGLARAIVDERVRGGTLRGMADLVERVDGIGPTRARRLARYLGFLPPTAPRVGASGDLAADLPALMAQEASGDAADRFLRMLDRVSMVVGALPHPFTRRQLPRTPKVPEPPEAMVAQRTMLLSGSRYYYHVRDAIGAAEEHVDVAMFHIALPAESHPTRQLLDALVDAKVRGVNVRVLVDRDRPSDPYNSTVINAAAIRHLVAGGVSVRVDASRKLLHSKFLVIDADHTIIGSHNWSAGSYFGFDDLSVDVESTALARATRERFRGLWSHGVRAPR